MESQRLTDLLSNLPIEKYNDVVDFIEFLVSRKEPELLLEECDECRYADMLKNSTRLNAEEVEKRLLGDK